MLFLFLSVNTALANASSDLETSLHLALRLNERVVAENEEKSAEGARLARRVEMLEGELRVEKRRAEILRAEVEQQQSLEMEIVNGVAYGATDVFHGLESLTPSDRSNCALRWKSSPRSVSADKPCASDWRRPRRSSSRRGAWRRK